MDSDIIINVLKQWNLWDRDIYQGLPRVRYIKKIYPYLKRREILVLKGIRRSGKSTLVRQLIYKLIKDGVDKNRIVYLNLEDYNFVNSLTIGLLEDVFRSYKEYMKPKGKIFFFIDEIQKIPHWEKWVRTKYEIDSKVKFIVTGSSASLLSKELSTLLTGRNIAFNITPLSFLDFKTFNPKGTLNDYLIYGGFPEVVLEKSKEKKKTLLAQYFTDIIYKDIIDRYNIRNAKQLFEIARYLVSTAGGKVSLNKLSKVFGLDKDTIKIYINYMIDAFLLFEVTYFSYSAKIKHDVSKLPKYYVVDNGLIYVSDIKYTKNIGPIFENTVLIKLLENFREIHYWSELQSEVDFIAGKQAINVTATDDIPDRELKGLRDFKTKYERFELLLITKSQTKGNKIGLIDFLKS